MKNTLTLTIVADITSNYSEGVGNISTIQKIHRNGKTYAMRSRESMKNALMVQSGFYDDVVTFVNGAAQKLADVEHNTATCRAYEGGYMTTGKNPYSRKGSFYLTDAIAMNSFVADTRFHTNVYLASNYAKAHNLKLQEQTDDTDVFDSEEEIENAKKGKKKEKKNPCGLMPYQYEYDRGLKKYSFTLFLDEIGVDENFKDLTVSNEEKADRVNTLLETLENLSLEVKGNLDNASPLFVCGGFTKYRTHVLENLVNIKNNKIVISKALKNKLNDGLSCGIVECGVFDNEDEIVNELCAVSVDEFFSNLRQAVKSYYGV